MVNRIKELCKENNITIKELERLLGFGNGTIRRWDNNRPAHERVTAVASFFNVPVSHFTGEPDKKEKPATIGDELTESQRYLIETVPKLSEEQAKMLRAVIEQVLDETAR